MTSVLLTNLFLTVLLILHTSNFSQACHLIPGDNPTSCMQLEATPYITETTSQFGPDIEGTSTNLKGHLFATNYGNESTKYAMGQIVPQQRLLYTDTLRNSYFNGLRFFNATTAFTVDVVNHRVLQLNIETQGITDVVVSSTIFCSNINMLQPNDLTISKMGTIFTSGMRWLPDTNDKDGDIWSCTPDGKATLLEVMGRTNGIDLSPDEKLLYVSEAYNANGSPYAQKVWVYDVNVNEGTISGKRLFIDFALVDASAAMDIDGIKTDASGNVFVIRHNGRSVAVFNAQGSHIGKIGLNFLQPTNLEFGGDEGTTLYIVGRCDNSSVGCVDVIEMAVVGRSWSILQVSSAANDRYTKGASIIACLIMYLWL